MNRKLLVLGLALLIIGLVTLPLASAQFGGGDSDNNDGSTDSGSSDGGTDSDSDTSSGSDSTEDSESTSDDSTDDSNYDGGDAQNNEEETSDTDTSDNTTDDQQTSSDSETSYDGGESQNNEEENSTNTNYDGGDAENNDNETEDQQENTTSSEDDTSEGQNTDPSPEDGSNNNETDQDNGNEEEKQPDEEDSSSDSPDSGSDEEDSDGGGFSPTNYIIEAVSQNSLQAEIDPETIQIGERSTVSGTLTGDDISNKRIEVLIDGQKSTTFTNEDGEFEKEIAPTTIGDKDINVKQDDLEESLSLKVTPTVRIFSMHTSLERSPGETIEVCADITSQADAELTLYHNDQTHNSKSGQGELCFNPTLEQGENRFQAVAVVEGDRDEEEITRSAHTYNDETTTLGPSTGSFLSSTTGIVAGVGILTAIIGGIIAKRRGINPLGPLT